MYFCGAKTRPCKEINPSVDPISAFFYIFEDLFKKVLFLEFLPRTLYGGIRAVLYWKKSEAWLRSVRT